MEETAVYCTFRGRQAEGGSIHETQPGADGGGTMRANRAGGGVVLSCLLPLRRAYVGSMSPTPWHASIYSLPAASIVQQSNTAATLVDHQLIMHRPKHKTRG